MKRSAISTHMHFPRPITNEQKDWGLHYSLRDGVEKTLGSVSEDLSAVFLCVAWPILIIPLFILSSLSVKRNNNT